MSIPVLYPHSLQKITDKLLYYEEIKITLSEPRYLYITYGLVSHVESKISYRQAFSVLMKVWALQTLLLAGVMVWTMSENQAGRNPDLLQIPLFTLLLQLDLVIFLLIALWSVAELAKDVNRMDRVLSYILIIGGCIYFISGAISYRVLLDIIPPNPISEYFIPLYDMDNVNPDATIDLSGLGNVANGVLYANIGLMLISIGLAILHPKMTAKISIVLYGVINLGLTLTVLLIPMKMFIVWIPLLIFAFITPEKTS